MKTKTPEKRGPGRPPIDNARTLNKKFRFSPVEWSEIAEFALECDRPAVDFVRLAALTLVRRREKP